MIDLSIIIVSWNIAETLEPCLSSIEKFTQKINKEIIVVDNASADQSVEMIENNFKEVILIKNKENFGFAKACNQGVLISRGKYILLLNPDTCLIADVNEMLDFINLKEGVGVVGCNLINEDNNKVIAYQSFPTILRIFTYFTGINEIVKNPKIKKILSPVVKLFPSQFGHHIVLEEIHEVDSIIGAFFMFRRELMNEIGMLDEQFFLYYEETDFCLRCQKHGLKNYFYPYYSAIHYCGKSAEKTNYGYMVLYARSLLYYFKKNAAFGGFLIARCVLFLSVCFRLISIFISDFSKYRDSKLKVFVRILSIV